MSQTLEIYEGIIVNKMTLKIKVELAVELYVFRKGGVTTDLIFVIKHPTECGKRVSDGIH